MKKIVKFLFIPLLFSVNLVNADAFHIQYYSIGWPYSVQLEIEGAYQCSIPPGGSIPNFSVFGIYPKSVTGNSQTEIFNWSLTMNINTPYNNASANFFYNGHITGHLPFVNSPINFAPEYHMDIVKSGNRLANVNCPATPL